MREIRWLFALTAGTALAGCVPANVAYRYRVDGRTYSVLRNADHYDAVGIASWYGPAYQGRPTASGEIYDMYAMTAASKVLPFYSYVRVTNLENGASEVVLINDRGPFYPGRIIDLSYAAAQAIDMVGPGTSKVRVQVLPNYSSSAEERAAAARATSPPPVAVTAGVFLRAGLFTAPQDARRLQDQLREVGLANVKLQPALYGGHPATIVAVGPLFTETAVNAAQALLAMEGIQATPYAQ